MKIICKCKHNYKCLLHCECTNKYTCLEHRPDYNYGYIGCEIDDLCYYENIDKKLVNIYLKKIFEIKTNASTKEQ